MTHYQIDNGVQTVTFSSEKEACEYLGVAQCSVASCYRSGVKCKGYTIRRIGDSFHRETKTRLHKVWESMLARCEYQKHPHFKSYGGRGIRVCAEWHKYENFRDWALQNGYSDSLTVDRINVNGNYEPSNCRFATMKQQQNNKRTNHIVSISGTSMTISECSEKFGIPKSTVRYRATHNYPILERRQLHTRLQD